MKGKGKHLKIIIFVTIFLLGIMAGENTALEKGKSIHSTNEEIKACEGKIKLKLLKVWGGEEGTDEEQSFYEPSTVEKDGKGQIYVLDTSNHRIQVFDKNSRFLRTIGRKGQGPGEFSYPVDMAIDREGHIVVSDGLNRRIQIFKQNGEYIEGFNLVQGFPGRLALTGKNEALNLNLGRAFGSSALLLLYDYQGEIVGKIGELQSAKSRMLEFSLNSCDYAVDSENNIYTGFVHKPIIRKYSRQGEILSEISFERKYKIPKIKVSTDGFGVEVMTVISSLTTDDQNRIFVVCTTRAKTEEEGRVGAIMLSGSMDNMKRSLVKHSVESDTTDLYELLVFDTDGKIKASKNLGVQCSRIRVHGDRLFVIDSYVGMKIYEFEVSFN